MKKFIALIGESKHIKDKIRLLGGKPNWHLVVNGVKTFGWIFGKKMKAEVESLINGTMLPEEVTKSDITNKVITEEKNIESPYKKHNKKNLIQFMIEHIDELKKSILGEMDIKSIVMNDTNFVKDDGKRYTFLGGGCGFSWIKVDKRNKLAVRIIEESESIKKDIEKKMVASIDKSYLKKLEACGNSIYAHFFQNLEYKSKYNAIVVRYMEKFVDTKKSKVWIDNRLD